MSQHRSTQIIKRIAGALATLAVLPTWAWFELQAVVLGRTLACISVSQQAALWPGMVGVYLRRALLKRILARVGEQVSVSMGTVLTKPSIELGNSVYIGSYCILGDVRIGDNTLIADRVSVITGQHGVELDIPIKDQPEEYRTLTIGVDCWIGNGAIILADVGHHCVIGAGSVVTKPVPDYLIVVGNPAKPIGDRRQTKVAT